MYVQVNVFDPWVCRLEPTGIPVSTRVGHRELCDEWSRTNMVSDSKVVAGMMWLTCEGECWKYFICET